MSKTKPLFSFAGAVLLVLLAARVESSTALSFQAENATIVNGTVASDHSGYTGTGFVDYFNQKGGYIEWTINVSQAGTYHMDFRYANGTAGQRPLEIRINSVIAASRLAFIGTGAWTTWQNQGLNYKLIAGANTIRATATTLTGGPNMDKITIGSAPLQGTDWGKAVVDSTMKRFPTAADLGAWHYSKAFFLYGAYMVYKRTGDYRYITYMRNWVDSHIDSTGTLDQTLDALDHLQGGNIFLILFQITGVEKYKLASDKFRQRFDTWPRTSDNGFWHMLSKEGQLWLDGTYMALPFLIRYGKLITDRTYAYDETTNQLLIYGSHLQDSTTGLYFHAYDEQGDISWADPITHHSCCFWGRSIGWYSMATMDVLDALPMTHANRAILDSKATSLALALATYQDPNTGRWYQVVDKPAQSGNWLETSASAMFTYYLSKSIQKGYLDSTTYQPYVTKGFNGVLAKISLGSDGLTNLADTSDQSGVGDLTYYLNRPKITNSMIGIGAFLVMYEQIVPKY